MSLGCRCGFFFFHDTATTEIYTLSLPDALPITGQPPADRPGLVQTYRASGHMAAGDRKSTRLNSSHVASSYAAFCVKKKKTEGYSTPLRRSRRKRTNTEKHDTKG